MAVYTYGQFEEAAKAAGLYDQFSASDLALAQNNPDAGMSLLSYKQQYANATTDADRQKANAGANSVRSSYGNYTGGTDGSGYYLDPLSPGSFEYGAVPSYTNNYSGDISSLWDQQKNYGTYNYGVAEPVYNNRYDEKIQDLLNQLINREAFSYDPSTDQLYSNYKKAYAREGQRATADTLAEAAAASGGIPSSYATTAAAQAGNYYAAQTADKIPELYELAYNKYLQDYNLKLNDLSAAQGAEQSDYDKYLNTLSQYNTNRAFDYTAWLDAYNMINNNLNTATGLEQLEYEKYLNDLNQYNTDRSFAYQNLLDEVNTQSAERAEALEKALYAAQYGDYSHLNNLGIDTAALLAESTGGTGGTYSSSDTTETEPASDDYVARFTSGDQSAEVIAGLVAMGYTEDEIKAAGYTGNYFDRSKTANNADRTYQRIYNQIQGGDYNAASLAGIIERANLTDAQKDKLLAMMGE